MIYYTNRDFSESGIETYNNGRPYCNEIFSTVVDTVSVEVIGKHGESIIELEQKLI